jgi:predicted GTPase
MANTRHSFRNALDLRHITELLNLHQSNSAHCCNEDTVFMMGNTGVGKSTTINYMCGRKVVKVLDEHDEFFERLEVENPIEGCAVGHGGDSLTRYLQSVVDPSGHDGKTLVFCDTPGFEDTEGSEVDIANAVAISWTIRQCRSVRLVLLINASMFADQRGVELNKLLHLFKRFLINTDDNLDSVSMF